MADKKDNPQEDPIPGQPAAVISQLERRMIQAPIAACLIREYAREMGQEKAIEIAASAIRADAAQAGKIIAGKLGGNSIKAMGQVVRDIWGQNGAITVQITEETEKTLCFNVTRCRYAEYYKEASMLELGYCLSCSRDEAFTQGFNDAMTLTRTHTIMEGYTVCDFRFSLEDEKTGVNS